MARMQSIISHMSSGDRSVRPVKFESLGFIQRYAGATMLPGCLHLVIRTPSACSPVRFFLPYSSFQHP